MKYTLVLLFLALATTYALANDDTALDTTNHTITIGHSKKELEPQEDVARPFQLTPYLLAELLLQQEAKYGADYGTIAPGDVEAGITVSYRDKLSASLIIALGDVYNIELNQAFINYAIKQNMHITAGLVESGFGILEFNSLSYPLIYDNLETIVPSLMFDFHGKALFGSVAMYQGVQTDNLLSFIPAIGVELGDIALLKASARLEFENNRSYSDISLGFALTPADFIEIRSEFVTDLQDKEEAGTPYRSMGYFAEAAFFIGNDWTLAGRYDDKITDYTVKDKEGIRAIEGSVRYTIFEPFSVAFAVTMLGDYTVSDTQWAPILSLQAHFDI